MDIRRNDTVIVLRGKDRGKRGRVLKVNLKTERAIVEAVNLVKKHVKPNPNVRQAGIVERPGFLAVSNLKLVCPKCSKASRVGHKVLPNETGHRNVRICKACNEQIE